MINCFYTNILKFDLINKFNYYSLFKIPKIIKFNLIFKSKNFKNLLISLVILKIISNKNSKFLLSFKKGIFMNSKVFFKYKLLNKVFKIIIVEFLPFVSFSDFHFFYIDNLVLFEKLKKLITINKISAKMKIIIILNNKIKQEFSFITKNLKISIIKDKIGFEPII